MNALSEAFPGLRGQSMKPGWRTLTAVSAGGAWLGRTKYERIHSASGVHTASPADWKCTVQIPEEYFDKILTAYARKWDDQIRKQLEWTDTEEQAFTELGHSR